MYAKDAEVPCQHRLKADILEELPKEIGEDAVKYIDRMVHYTTFGAALIPQPALRFYTRAHAHAKCL